MSSFYIQFVLHDVWGEGVREMISSPCPYYSCASIRYCQTYCSIFHTSGLLHPKCWNVTRIQDKSLKCRIPENKKVGYLLDRFMWKYGAQNSRVLNNWKNPRMQEMSPNQGWCALERRRRRTLASASTTQPKDDEDFEYNTVERYCQRLLEFRKRQENR